MKTEFLEETTDHTGNSDFAYQELSPLAKKLLSICYQAVSVTPLESCRIMQEDAPLHKFSALREVERYLINE